MKSTVATRPGAAGTTASSAGPSKPPLPARQGVKKSRPTDMRVYGTCMFYGWFTPRGPRGAWPACRSNLIRSRQAVRLCVHHFSGGLGHALVHCIRLGLALAHGREVHLDLGLGAGGAHHELGAACQAVFQHIRGGQGTDRRSRHKKPPYLPKKIRKFTLQL